MTRRTRIEEWMSVLSARGTLVREETFETDRIGPVTVRRVDDERVVVRQEPFAGDTETLSGVVVVDVPSRDDAVDLAKTWPTGETIEVRPVRSG